MKKEIKKYVTACDYCEIDLTDIDHISKGEIDLCYSCGGKILNNEIIDKILEEKLKEFIDKDTIKPLSKIDINDKPQKILNNLDIPEKKESSVKSVQFLSDL